MPQPGPWPQDRRVTASHASPAGLAPGAHQTTAARGRRGAGRAPDSTVDDRHVWDCDWRLVVMRWRTLGRIAATVFVALVVTGAVAAVGIAGARGEVYTARGPSAPSAPVDAVAAPTHDPGKPTAVILLGPEGANAADVLAPYEVLAATGAFNLYTVAPQRQPVPLTGGLDLVPDLSFGQLDQRLPDRPRGDRGAPADRGGRRGAAEPGPGHRLAAAPARPGRSAAGGRVRRRRGAGRGRPAGRPAGDLALAGPDRAAPELPAGGLDRRGQLRRRRRPDHHRRGAVRGRRRPAGHRAAGRPGRGRPGGPGGALAGLLARRRRAPIQRFQAGARRRGGVALAPATAGTAPPWGSCSPTGSPRPSWPRRSGPTPSCRTWPARWR